MEAASAGHGYLTDRLGRQDVAEPLSATSAEPA
jgi:hypothetical protein